MKVYAFISENDAEWIVYCGEETYFDEAVDLAHKIQKEHGNPPGMGLLFDQDDWSVFDASKWCFPLPSNLDAFRTLTGIRLIRDDCGGRKNPYGGSEQFTD